MSEPKAKAKAKVSPEERVKWATYRAELAPHVAELSEARRRERDLMATQLAPLEAKFLETRAALLKKFNLTVAEKGAGA